jgi:hypothetical protein
VSGILFKDESGKAKQSIPPKTWTYVKFQSKDKFVVPETGVWEWTVVLRVEYPAGAGDVLRGRLCRYPGTDKLDETGHDDKNTSGWAGSTYHSHWSHTIDCNPKMPIGFWVWHNGAAPIVLDGRQIKAKKI